MEHNGAGASAHNQERLAEGLKEAIDTAEETLRATLGEISKDTVEIKDRLVEALRAAKEAYALLAENVAASAKATDRAIRENPYPAVAVALGVGLVVGVMAKRK